ncbi:hypothetical protein ASC94_10915 [Massilia sp. Root418]|uniref:hypothetical protein n=1 Tax=Massilia sp. Root418 TaxID=1736532 RepID=UPI0006FA6406|nr:hypothetical protein [Massilia sp. Root418]KQW93181.1 hypothetical protein ASC94_10915 [Massilia sp. Root418]
MRSVVYGGCIEPEGYKLEDVSYEDVCQACGQPGARYRRWETADGAINQHWQVNCRACGHEDGDMFWGQP